MPRIAKWLGLAAAALTALALGSCAPAAKKPPPNELHIYNWSDYIDKAILDDFTKETGIKVVYDTFDTAEALETKVLTGGTGYDIVAPPNHILPRLIAAGALQPLDKAKLPNSKNLWPDLMKRLDPFDPGAKFATPYMWGTIGIGYNKDAVAKRLPGVAIDSWAVVFKPENLAKLSDCGVYFLDAAEDMYAVSLSYLGRNPNSADPADYKAATDMLLKVRPYVTKFHSSAYIEALANGDACIVIGYSGDVLQARDRAEEAGGKVKIDYVIPKEGTQVWFDTFAIPKDAPNPEGALKFMDYMMRPQVIARASNATQYANANSAATPLVDAGVRGNPNVYPTPEVFDRLFVTAAKDSLLQRQVNRDWTTVLTGK